LKPPRRRRLARQGGSASPARLLLSQPRGLPPIGAAAQAQAAELPSIKTVSVGSDLLSSLADLSLTSLNGLLLSGDLGLAATALSLDTPLLQLAPDARVVTRRQHLARQQRSGRQHRSTDRQPALIATASGEIST
jgi:hypothetical protein